MLQLEYPNNLLLEIPRQVRPQTSYLGQTQNTFHLRSSKFIQFKLFLNTKLVNLESERR